MKHALACRWFLLVLLMGWPVLVRATDDPWAAALRAMPVPPTAINRSNAVDVLLDAFQSNAVVKAIVVLPGVSDDFYLVHRDAPPLNLRATNLFNALAALTNATPVRVTWRAPFVLLHTRGDVLQPSVRIEDPAAVVRFRLQRLPGCLTHLDAHWERVQPALEKALGRPVQPEGASTEAWHYHRHNLAGCNLTGWELLEAMSLTGGTRVTVQKRGIFFQNRVTP